ncbi:MAG: hypothetical protein LUE27_05850 [Clostridia bacterium]|nr:hypothetical protein [Clostridia bacterium]
MKFAEKLGVVCMLAGGVMAAFSLGSCDKEPKEEPVTVVFPEAKTLNVLANTTETLNFTINADWILYSDAKWATFNGELSAAGGAGDVTVEIEISDLGQTLEETSVAYLTLAAGSEEQVIYTVNRAPAGTVFSITDADGNEVTALTAGWRDYDYYTISANFVFAVSDESRPDWLETEDAVTNSTYDPCTAGFKVVDDATVYKYAQEGKITFANESGKISFEYPITFAGMDADGIEIDGAGRWNWTVNKDGTAISHEGIEAELSFTITVLNDDYVIANADYTYADDWIFYVNETYDLDSIYDDEAAAWIHVVSDDGKGNISFSVDATTSARKAFVFAFPRAVYDALNDAHNGYGLNWLPGDDGDLEGEYDQYVIADIEQTTASGEESFSAYSGTTMAEIEVETECPDGYDFSSVLADYSGAHVGYIPWQVGTSMMVAVLPLLSADVDANLWAMDPAAYDANGDSCYGQSYYDIEGSGSFYSGNSSYCGVLVYLNSTPQVNWFYLVFNNSDAGETWVLFFYGEGTGTDEYGLVARVSTNTGASYTDVEIETTCPESLNTPSQRGACTPKDIIEEYGTTNVGYIPYQKGAQFNTTATPLGSANYAEGYDSWDESIYTYGKNWGSDYEGICEYEGGSYANGEYFGTTLYCVDNLPDGIDFVFLAYKASDDDDDAIGLLFFYKDTSSGGDEPTTKEFCVYNGASMGQISFNTEYTGTTYDLTDILAKYNPAATGYIDYALNTSYNVSFTDVSTSDEWIYDVKAYTYSGESVLSTLVEPTNGYINGKSMPCANVYVEEDPETLFYLVFNDGTNYYLFFFTTDKVPSDGGDDNGNDGDENSDLFVVVGGDYSTTYELTDEFSTSYTQYVSLYSTLSTQYNTTDIQCLKFSFPDSGGATFIIAPLPLSSSNEWAYDGQLYDGDGDLASSWGGGTIEGTNYYSGSSSYPAVNVYFPGSGSLPFYVLFNDGTNYRILILTDM